MTLLVSFFKNDFFLSFMFVSLFSLPLSFFTVLFFLSAYLLIFSFVFWFVPSSLKEQRLSHQGFCWHEKDSEAPSQNLRQTWFYASSNELLVFSGAFQRFAAIDMPCLNSLSDHLWQRTWPGWNDAPLGKGGGIQSCVPRNWSVYIHFHALSCCLLCGQATKYNLYTGMR